MLLRLHGISCGRFSYATMYAVSLGSASGRGRGALTLDDLKAGESGTVRTVAADSARRQRRFLEMGITPETQVTVQRVAPLGDPIEIALRGYMLAIRRDDARRITVKKLRAAAPPNAVLRAERARGQQWDASAARSADAFTNTCADLGCGACAARRKTPRKAAARRIDAPVRLALIGNPNAGKTTLFNAVTGAKEHVGNRPGVTVEIRERRVRAFERMLIVADLPGIYAMSACSEEERAAKDYILSAGADVVVNIVDATNLERNLYLTLQLRELGLPIVMALNMMDETARLGIDIDVAALSGRLGIPIVPISARTGAGVETLIERCVRLAESAPREKAERRGTQREAAEDAWTERQALQTERRYRTIAGICRAAVRQRPVGGKTRSDRIDAVLLNRFLGIPIFLMVMGIIFLFTFDTVGSWLSDGAERMVTQYLIPWARLLLTGQRAPDWLIGLACDGVLAGAGAVVTFLPQIAILFLLLSLLEDSGYMARTAFLMDRVLRRFGLSGKSFIPMLMGMGCTVPAAMSARTIEDQKDRNMTILLLPFVSCSAKLPVYGMVASAFFPHARGLIVLSLYCIGLMTGAATGLLFNKTLFAGDDAPFVMELPPYRLPTWNNTLQHVGQRLEHFLKRAGTVICLMNAVLWVLMRYDVALSVVSAPQQSMLGRLGTMLAPLLAPLGFGCWQMAVALLTGVIAKEAVVSTLTLLAPVGAAAWMQGLNAMDAYCFLLFVLLYVPCIAAVATMRREMKSVGLTAFMICYQLMTAYLMTLLVRMLGGWLF